MGATSVQAATDLEPLICEQGNYVDGMLLINCGFARVSEKVDFGERTIGHISRNDVFGLREIAGMTENDRLEICLNGHLIPDEAIGRTLPSDAQPTSEEDLTRAEGEKRLPCFPERGWYDLRLEPGPAFSTRWFSLSAAMAVDGENILSVALGL